MKTCVSSLPIFARVLPRIICLGLFCVLALPPLPVEAATSREKRKLRILKRTLRSVKKDLVISQRELAITEGELAISESELATTESELAMTQDELAMALLPPPFMEFVTVGDPGNGTDPGNPVDPNIYGAVTDPFKIGKYEVTNGQYVAFLNAVAETDSKGLFVVQMETEYWGGIVRFGTNGSYRYAVKAGMGAKPVVFMHFHNACRFCNWLHNDQPVGLQGASTTELGAYDLTAPAVLANNNVVRSPGAKFFIPTEDQWYKTAHFQPASDSGDTDNYWTYATGSNVLPAEAMVDAIGEVNNDNGNLANYNLGADWDLKDGHLTTVGSGGPGSASYYGAFDICGNVIEITEGKQGSINESRVARGGGFATNPLSMDQVTRSNAAPDNPNSDHGFRVACPAD